MLLRPHRSLRCATESCFSIRGNRENEFASFQGLRHGTLAISSQQSRQKTTLAQWVRNSSRATTYATAFAAHHARGSTLSPPDTTFRRGDTMVHRPTMLRARDTTTTTRSTQSLGD